MNSNSMIFLLVLMMGGVLFVTLVYYGGQLALRLLETPDPAQVPEHGQTTAVHPDPSLSAPTLNHVGAADPQSAVLRV